MDRDYGTRYSELYHHHWWWRAREEFLVRLLRRHVGASETRRILDFGCGDGLFFPALTEFGDPYGIEPDAELLDPSGPWRNRIDTSPMTPDPEQASRYHLVLALDVLEHIEEPRPVVEEIARRLEPGGWFIATVPAFQSLWTTHDDLNHHVRRYRLGELEALIEGSGLQIVRSLYLFGWVAIAKWLVARAEAVASRPPRAPRIPPKPVNQAALGFSRLEQRLHSVVPLPFGSTALVVSRLGL
jgi:SAM-dependent methyltransferase